MDSRIISVHQKLNVTQVYILDFFFIDENFDENMEHGKCNQAQKRSLIKIKEAMIAKSWFVLSLERSSKVWV